ncbi:uncharacterized protein I206_101204 [Kwoniella pini CBS 10737]|uniref:Uncharacterized protein n=1 Tax=Kwoniella pini CBS 10737 TaxID=1296096 RepID=A0A1B9IBL9_9TREE|nr:uncharacterized protein I206_00119 [Kwoniella pini CBS 10737]OCF52823.1 hypothetical protein I206_00119 [Kwoniella pini CBS 10737]
MLDGNSEVIEKYKKPYTGETKEERSMREVFLAVALDKPAPRRPVTIKAPPKSSKEVTKVTPSQPPAKSIFFTLSPSAKPFVPTCHAKDLEISPTTAAITSAQMNASAVAESDTLSSASSSDPETWSSSCSSSSSEDFNYSESDDEEELQRLLGIIEPVKSTPPRTVPSPSIQWLPHFSPERPKDEAKTVALPPPGWVFRTSIRPPPSSRRHSGSRAVRRRELEEYEYRSE